jgi:hypothetical protein
MLNVTINLIPYDLRDRLNANHELMFVSLLHATHISSKNLSYLINLYFGI